MKPSAQQPALSLDTDFVVLSPEKDATIERADATLYQRLDDEYHGFAGHELISSYTFSTDWSSWEMHPKGDEIVVLLTGKATFVLQLASGEQTVVLEKQGEYAVVPKGVWHTAKTDVETKMLFITPGEATQHKGL